MHNGIEPSNETSEDIIQGIRNRSSKRDKKANTVHGFQHVTVFACNKTAMHLVVTNIVTSNPSTIGDAQISMDVIGPSKFVAQGKIISTQPIVVSATLYQVESSRTMRKHCNNMECQLT